MIRVIFKDISLMSKTMLSCSEFSFIHLHSVVVCREAVCCTQLWFCWHHCLSAKPCDSYQETWAKRSGLLYKGRNNILQLGHEIHWSMWSDRKDAETVCVFTHQRDTHGELWQSTDSAHSCWNSASLHHLMCCHHSHPPKNKMYHTPLRYNDATLGVIIVCCVHMECCGFLHFPS